MQAILDYHSDFLIKEGHGNSWMSAAISLSDTRPINPEVHSGSEIVLIAVKDDQDIEVSLARTISEFVHRGLYDDRIKHEFVLEVPLEVFLYDLLDLLE